MPPCPTIRFQLVEATKTKSKKKPELFFGLVAPLGSDLSSVTEDLKQALASVAYRCETLHLIEQVHELEPWKELPESPLIFELTSIWMPGTS